MPLLAALAFASHSGSQFDWRVRSGDRAASNEAGRQDPCLVRKPTPIATGFNRDQRKRKQAGRRLLAIGIG